MKLVGSGSIVGNGQYYFILGWTNYIFVTPAPFFSFDSAKVKREQKSQHGYKVLTFIIKNFCSLFAFASAKEKKGAG